MRNKRDEVIITGLVMAAVWMLGHIANSWWGISGVAIGTLLLFLLAERES